MTDAPIVIVGSGMAGYSLARELRKMNADIPVTVICRDSGDSYAKPTLSNAFAQNKVADTIAIASAEKMAESLNITVLNFYEVAHIDAEQKIITYHPVLASDKQQRLAYAKLVLATGAHSRPLPQVQIDQRRVFAVNHLDDYKLFQQTIETLYNRTGQTTKVAIIGAGLIGCEFANDLISKNQTSDSPNLHITVYDKAALPMAQLIPSIAGQALQTALSDAGVTFKLNVDITAIHVNEGNVLDKDNVSIEFRDVNGNTNTATADVMLIAIGLVANTQLAEDIGLAVAHLHADKLVSATHLPRTAQQGIIVNQFLQTSDPDIYALGDCANVIGSFMPYVMPLMNQAKALAKTLANSTEPPTAVAYPAMPVAIKTPSLPLVVLPVPSQYSDEMISWQQTPTADGFILTAYPKGDSTQLLGFVLAGKAAGKQRLTLSKQVADWFNA